MTQTLTNTHFVKIKNAQSADKSHSLAYKRTESLDNAMFEKLDFHQTPINSHYN